MNVSVLKWSGASAWTSAISAQTAETCFNSIAFPLLEPIIEERTHKSS